MSDGRAVETEATELLRTLIRNKCVNDGTVGSGQETRNVAALEDYFAGSGLSCEKYTSKPGRESLIVRIEGSDPSAPRLLLMGHTDVVPVSPDGWRRDPFEGELEDGIVWGRGPIDMLNRTATMAVATRRLARSAFRPRGTLIYLAVADEEAGGTHGAGHLVEREPDAVKTDYVITENGGVPIPTSTGHVLTLGVGEKGANWRRLTVAGTPGHGSRPFRTDNALVTAAEVVRRIGGYHPKARIFDVWRRYVEALELDAELTRDLTDADRVEIDVDIRALPGVTPEEVDAMLAEALGELAPRVTITHGRAEPGSLSSPDTPLFDSVTRIAEKLLPGSRVVPRLTTGGTDGKFFRWRNIPAYGFGLHSLRIPHTEYPIMFHGRNERVDTESLKLSAMMWEALCRDFLA